jgi:hypothetical protein
MERADWHMLIVTIGAMLVPGIYLFRLHKILLLGGTSAVVTRWLFVASAIVGLTVAVRDRNRPAFGLAVALLSPLVHSLAFRKTFRWFVRVVGREPADVYDNWTPGLAADRAFAILFSLVCIFATMAAWGTISWGIAKPGGATG